MQPQLFSGARGEISYQDLNGNPQLLTMALDINVSVTDSVRQTFSIGSYNAVSNDPVGIDVNVSIGRVIPVNKLTSTQPSGQITAMDLGLEAPIQTVLTSEALTISIVDRITNKTIALIKECRFAGRSSNAGASDVASERLNFVGILDLGYNGENSGALLGYNSANA